MLGMKKRGNSEHTRKKKYNRHRRFYEKSKFIVEISAAEGEILIRKKQYFNSGITLLMEGC
jgi:hypothetical protein